MEKLYKTELTIIIATYNAEATLKRALESVILLSYQNWECLVIDGASTDRTMNIVQDFERIDGRIRHISESDHGLYDAFNKGIKNAKGDWIYYLGADDLLTINGIEELMNCAAFVGENVAVVSGGVIRIRQDNSKRIMLSKGFIGSHQSMIMRREVLENMHGFNYNMYKILADYDLFIRLKNSGYEVMNCDAIVAYFQAGGTSENLSKMLQIAREKYSILKCDKYCTSPLWVTITDTIKSVAGNVFHRMHKKCCCVEIIT